MLPRSWRTKGHQYEVALIEEQWVQDFLPRHFDQCDASVADVVVKEFSSCPKQNKGRG